MSPALFPIAQSVFKCFILRAIAALRFENESENCTPRARRETPANFPARPNSFSNMLPLDLAHLLIGIALLFFGRKLFWLFVGAIGFIAGVNLAAMWLHGSPAIVVLLIAIIFGALGAWLAYAAQKIAVACAGFFSGGYLFSVLLGAWELQAADRQGVTFLVGGLIGAVLMLVLFDWTLIALSSIGGAHLIALGLHLHRGIAALVVFALVLCGILFQANIVGKSRRR